MDEGHGAGAGAGGEEGVFGGGVVEDEGEVCEGLVGWGVVVVELVLRCGGFGGGHGVSSGHSATGGTRCWCCRSLGLLGYSVHIVIDIVETFSTDAAKDGLHNKR